MKDLLNKIIENNALFIGVIVALSIILLLLVVLIVKSAKSNKKINIYEEDLEDEDLKKVKNVKKEDIIETPDDEFEDELELDEDDLFNFDEEETGLSPVEEQDDLELAKRYHEEEEKEIEEVKEQSKGSEIEKLITKMEEDSKLKPEDVVEKFEKEQEAQSIISYKELVNAVKNRSEDIYEDELESQPLATVSDLMEELENSNIYDDEEEEEVIIPKKEEKKPEVRETKFRKTEVISPVFGRVEVDDTPSYDYYEEPVKEKEEVIEDKKRVVSEEETIDLSDVDLSDYRFTGKKPVEEVEGVTALDEIYKHMADNMVKEEKAPNKEAVEKLSRNEEFLQSLKDFRNKL